MSYFCLRSQIEYLAATIGTGQIHKVLSYNDNLCLKLWNSGLKNFHLMFQLSNQLPSVAFYHKFPEILCVSHFFRHAFTDLLKGCWIREFSMSDRDKVFSLVLDRGGRFIKGKKIIFLFEFLPRYVNAIVLDENSRILQLFKPDVKNRLVTGQLYKSPPLPTTLKNVEQFDFDNFENNPDKASGISGFPRPFLDFLSGKMQKKGKLKETVLKIISGDRTFFNPTFIGKGAGQLHCFRESSVENAISFPDFQMLYHHVQNSNWEFSLLQVKNKWLKDIKKKIKSLQSLQKKEEKSLKQALRFKEIKEKGITISHNLYRLDNKKKVSSISIKTINSKSEREETINLNGRITILENMNLFFRKSKKLQRSIEPLKKTINLLNLKINYLIQLDYQIQESATFTGLAEFEDEIEKLFPQKYGFKSGRKSRKKAVSTKKKSTIVPFVENAGDGWKIYLGQSSIRNAYITFKLGKDEDFWFHVHQAPGAHVLLKYPHHMNKEIENEFCFMLAAALAVIYSKKRGGGKTLVDFTRKKNLIRRKGFPQGYVTYKKYQQIRVDPQQECFKDYLNGGKF
ncbi:NFACT family protein [Candidatus Riflebacteria bacterium]